MRKSFIAAAALAALITLAAAPQGQAARCLACGTEYNGTSINGTATGGAAQVLSLRLPDVVTLRG